MSLKEKIKHAFAVDSEHIPSPNSVVSESIDEICSFLIKKRLEVPVEFAIESSKPLGFISSQAMHMLTPLASILLNVERWRQLALYLEHRRAPDYFLNRIATMRSFFDLHGRLPKSGELDMWISKNKTKDFAVKKEQ